MAGCLAASSTTWWNDDILKLSTAIGVWNCPVKGPYSGLISLKRKLHCWHTLYVMSSPLTISFVYLSIVLSLLSFHLCRGWLFRASRKPIRRCWWRWQRQLTRQQHIASLRWILLATDISLLWLLVKQPGFILWKVWFKWTCFHYFLKPAWHADLSFSYPMIDARHGLFDLLTMTNDWGICLGSSSCVWAFIVIWTLLGVTTVLRVTTLFHKIDVSQISSLLHHKPRSYRRQ